MQVMKISPFFGVRKNAGWDLLPTSNQSLWGKRSVWSDSWGPPELFVEVEGTEVIFHFDPKLNGRFHHLISSWRDASKLSQEIWPQEFFKKPPQLWVASHVNLGRQNSFVNGMEPDPTFFGEKATVATADKPVPTFGESLCLSWFFLGPQWSIKNRHVAAVFCIFAWNHQSHFAVNTAVVFPRSSGSVKSLMKATAFFLTCFSWRYNGGCIFFRPGPKKIHEKYSSYDFVETKPKPFQPWATKTEMPSFAEKKDCFRDRNCWSKKTSIILGKLCYYRWKSCNNRDPLQHQHAANSTPTSPAWIAHRSLIAICRIRDSRIVAQPLLPLVP